MSINIQKKLRTMTKSQLEEVCHKMKCPTGTKKEMVGHLLRPFGMKYKMDFMTLHDKKKRIQDMTLDQLTNWALKIQTVEDPLEQKMVTEMFLNDLKRRGLNELEMYKNLKKTERIFGSTKQPSHFIKF